MNGRDGHELSGYEVATDQDLSESAVPLAGVYLAQAWKGQERVCQVEGLAYDVARMLVESYMATGLTGRLMFENPTTEAEDYCEVHRPDGTVLTGKFGEVTFVRVPADWLREGNNR